MLSDMFWKIRRRFSARHLSCEKLTISLGVVILLLWRFYLSPTSSVKAVKDSTVPRILHKWDGKGFRIYRDGVKVLYGTLGSTFPISNEPNLCEFNSECLKSTGIGDVKVHTFKDEETQCYQVKTTSLKSGFHPTDCFSIKGSHWYGGAETYHDRWPIVMNIKTHPHVSDTGSYGSVLERYWFSSAGVAIFVDDLTPLFVKANEEEFCLIGNYDNDVYRNWNGEDSYLSYVVCVGDNVKDVHTHMLRKYIARPKDIPDQKMIKYPVWSTWAKYKSYITQELTINFTNEIAGHGFPACQIELDDIYTVNYGDYIFNLKKFPDPKAMIEHIHSKGFRITVWTHPFSNMDSESFKVGDQRGYWVMDESGLRTGRAGWWRGHGGVLDVTNPKAVTWYFSRLQKLHDLGVDGHKYDAGEIGFLPPKFRTSKRLENPCHYSRMYAETMYNNTNKFMQVRVGYKTQHLPIFVSMMDRNSVWGYNMGLRSLITTSLVFGSMGYYFIMPDMIGGNAYCAGNMDCNDVKPERELYIRWLQLNAFLPMMQFSFTPWQYDQEVVEIAKRYVDLHAEYVAPRIIFLARESTNNGYPIIRPMWWEAPDDPDTYTMDSQFMVGDDLLVAPILEKGARKRDVYLPKGIWRAVLTEQEYVVREDRFYVHNVAAELSDIPYFERISF